MGAVLTGCNQGTETPTSSGHERGPCGACAPDAEHQQVRHFPQISFGSVAFTPGMSLCPAFFMPCFFGLDLPRRGLD